MKKYLRHACTTCGRTLDRLVDNARVVPDKCTITLGCRGRLFPVDYTSEAELAVAPEVGVVDWHPRNQPTNPIQPLVEPRLVGTSTGDLGQLVLALALPSSPSALATATLDLAVQASTPKAYRHYTFRFEASTTSVAGVESAVERKTLRFTAFGANPDLVEVYVNGVKLEQGPGAGKFQVYDGTSTPPAPPNTVVLGTAVSGTGSQVDVVVSKAAEVEVLSLQFHRNIDNPARTFLGAWENVDFVKYHESGVWVNYYLFTYDVLESTDLNLNALLIPTGTVLVVDGGGTAVPLSAARFLLAKSPFTYIDRYTSIHVPLDGLSFSRDYLKYHMVDSVPALEIVETGATTVYPALRVQRLDPELTVKTSTPGSAEQVTLDGSVVVGPDA